MCVYILLWLTMVSYGSVMYSSQESKDYDLSKLFDENSTPCLNKSGSFGKKRPSLSITTGAITAGSVLTVLTKPEESGSSQGISPSSTSGSDSGVYTPQQDQLQVAIVDLADCVERATTVDDIAQLNKKIYKIKTKYWLKVRSNMDFMSLLENFHNASHRIVKSQLNHKSEYDVFATQYLPSLITDEDQALDKNPDTFADKRRVSGFYDDDTQSDTPKLQEMITLFEAEMKKNS